MHTLKLTKQTIALWLCVSLLPGVAWAQGEASEKDEPAQAEQRETESAPSEGEKRGSQPEGDSTPPAPRAFKPSEEVHADTILTMPADF